MQAQRNSLLLDRVSGTATFRAIEAVRVVTIEYDDRAFAFSGEQLEDQSPGGGALPRATRSPAALRDRLRQTRARMHTEPASAEPNPLPAQAPLSHSPQVELDWDSEGPETEIDLDEVVRTMRIPRDRLAVDAPNRDEESQVARVNQARPAAQPQACLPTKRGAVERPEARPAPSLSFSDEPEPTRRTRHASTERARTTELERTDFEHSESATATRAREASAEYERPAQASATRSSSLPPPPPAPRRSRGLQAPADETQRTGLTRREPTPLDTPTAALSRQSAPERTRAATSAHDELARPVESWREPTQRTLHSLADDAARSSGYPALDRDALQLPAARSLPLGTELDELARTQQAPFDHTLGAGTDVSARLGEAAIEATSAFDQTVHSFEPPLPSAAAAYDTLGEGPWQTAGEPEWTPLPPLHPSAYNFRPLPEPEPAWSEAQLEAEDTDDSESAAFLARELPQRREPTARTLQAHVAGPARAPSAPHARTALQGLPRPPTATAEEATGRRRVPPTPPRGVRSVSQDQTARSLPAIPAASPHAGAQHSARHAAVDYDAMWDAVQPLAPPRPVTQAHPLPPSAAVPAFARALKLWQQKPWLIPAAASAVLALAGAGAAIALRGPARFEVILEVTPPDAQVSVDGRVLASSSGERHERLPLGRHTLAVKKSGFVSEERSISGDQRGSVQQVRMSLTAETHTAALSVSSIPSGAAIRVDGHDTGQTTPAALRDLALGAHAVTLQLEGYASAEQAVRLPEDALVSISLVPNAPKAPAARESVRVPAAAAPQLTEALLTRRAQVRAARATCRQNARNGEPFDPEAESVLRAIGESCLMATTPASAK